MRKSAPEYRRLAVPSKCGRCGGTGRESAELQCIYCCGTGTIETAYERYMFYWAHRRKGELIEWNQLK